MNMSMRKKNRIKPIQKLPSILHDSEKSETLLFSILSNVATNGAEKKDKDLIFIERAPI